MSPNFVSSNLQFWPTFCSNHILKVCYNYNFLEEKSNKGPEKNILPDLQPPVSGRKPSLKVPWVCSLRDLLEFWYNISWSWWFRNPASVDVADIPWVVGIGIFNLGRKLPKACPTWSSQSIPSRCGARGAFGGIFLKSNFNRHPLGLQKPMGKVEGFFGLKKPWVNKPLHHSDHRWRNSTPLKSNIPQESVCKSWERDYT